VGVIANLALWFGLRVLFGEVRGLALGPVTLDLPVPATLDPAALALAMLAAVCLFRLRLGVVRTLGVAAAAGLLLRLAAG
jgi:chromate transporter